MRESWERQSVRLELQKAQVLALIEPAFPGQSLIHYRLVSGGLSNTNIHAELSHHPDPILLRIYVRDPAQAAKEWTLLSRLAGQVPVPRLYYTAPGSSVLPYPYALMEWIEGERLEIALEQKIAPADLQQMISSIGRVLARMHAMKFDVTGFLDKDLQVVTPISIGSDGLLDYLEQKLGGTAPGRDRLGADLADAVIDFAGREGGLLDSWTGAPSLIHGDFGGSNILVRQDAQGWRTAAILDWEFAFSGTPFFDLGNLLRPPLGSLAGVGQAIEAGYRDAGGLLPPEWRRMSDLVELISWAEFLARPNCGPKLAADARAMIRRVMNDFTRRK
jgi:aminoglycoside phosphotransferase (APT) family kinase protein